VIAQQAAGLSQLLEAGVIRDDYGRVMENGGFTADIWNRGDSTIVLRVRCGVRSKWLANAVSMELPSLDSSAAGELYRLDVARHVVIGLAECWEPEWATLTSHSLRRAQRAPPRTPVVGWMTYLERPRSVNADALPEGVWTEEIGAGTLITIGSDARAVTQSMVVAVRDSLGNALAARPMT
jgi:hypothetical protein